MCNYEDAWVDGTGCSASGGKNSVYGADIERRKNQGKLAVLSGGERGAFALCRRAWSQGKDDSVLWVRSGRGVGEGGFKRQAPGKSCDYRRSASTSTREGDHETFTVVQREDMIIHELISMLFFVMHAVTP
nr:hypothetical protein 13E11.190 [imported] - Neurospora crassa [Neurospora crassa]